MTYGILKNVGAPPTRFYVQSGAVAEINDTLKAMEVSDGFDFPVVDYKGETKEGSAGGFKQARSWLSQRVSAYTKRVDPTKKFSVRALSEEVLRVVRVA